MFWRPIVRGIATLQEIEDHWDLCDVLDANEALDVMDELEELNADKYKNKQSDGWK